MVIADLRQEVRAGNPGLIGEVTPAELEENLRRGEQSILLAEPPGQ